MQRSLNLTPPAPVAAAAAAVVAAKHWRLACCLLGKSAAQPDPPEAARCENTTNESTVDGCKSLQHRRRAELPTETAEQAKYLGCRPLVALPHDMLVPHSSALVEDLAVVLQPLAEDEALRMWCAR